MCSGRAKFIDFKRSSCAIIWNFLAAAPGASR